MTTTTSCGWLCLFLLLLLLPVASQHDTSLPVVDKHEVKRLQNEAFSLPQGSAQAIDIWNHILQLDPRSSNARVQLGLHGMQSSDGVIQESALTLLSEAFNQSLVDMTIPMPSQQGVLLASVIGRYRWEQKDYSNARHFIQLAYNHSQQGGMNFLSTCLEAQLATMLDPFPVSIHAADESLEFQHQYSTKLLSKLKNEKQVQFNERALSALVMGAAPDPYVHCMLTIFHLSFYYRANVARVANTHYQISTALWPKLSYVSPNLKTSNKHQQKSQRHCKDKIRLGIASGCFSPRHSVVADFSGVLSRLDRNKFDITYIYLNEQNSQIDDFVYRHASDTVLNLQKTQQDVANGDWVKRYHQQIEELDLDILLYLDLTMGSHAQRLAMAKLAPVQAVSHGHPITSGISRNVMNYYISWEAAELEYNLAQQHYVEELVLLPKNVPHQYYEQRLDDTKSLINGKDYRLHVQNGRNGTFPSIPAHGHWYLCMQKPHKFHPEMDSLVCNILEQDDEAIVILHKEETRHNNNIFQQRLRQAGCDLTRVYFLPVQPHDVLLALYSLADVILDWLGCTTSREALELGKPIVTLPGRLLGSRWTFGYYQIMGDPLLNEMVIAESEQEYVKLAVALGTNQKLREEASERIKAILHKLYHRNESVEAWEKVLLDISPVTLEEEGRRCGEDSEKVEL